MRDHDDGLPRVLLGQAAQCLHDPRVKLPCRLAAGHATIGIKAQPLRPCLRVPGLDVVHAHAIDHTKMLLAQARVGQGIERQLRQQRGQRGLRRLPRADEVAAHQVIDRQALRHQPLRQAAGLLVPGGVEGHIHLALEAQLAVPVGFAMADEDEFGHAPIIKCRHKNTSVFVL